MSWSTVSKAALRSKRTRSVTWPMSIFIRISFLTFSNAISVEWCSRYALCISGNKPLVSMWVCNWIATAFSGSLEVNCELLIGQKFLFTSSSPGFLSNRCTKAYFHSSANWPVFSDKLMIFVMTGKRWSKCIDSIEDGSGSMSHEFFPG